MKSSAYPPLLQTAPHIWTTNPFLQENIDPPFYDFSKIPNPYKEGGKRGEKGGGRGGGSHYNLFKSNCLSLMVHGPNISTPLCVNGDTSRHLTLGKSAIFCTPNLPYSLKQLKHLYVIPLTTMLALSIQNPICLKLFKVIPIPQWATLSWYHCMIFPDMLPCFGRTTG